MCKKEHVVYIDKFGARNGLLDRAQPKIPFWWGYNCENQEFSRLMIMTGDKKISFDIFYTEIFQVFPVHSLVVHQIYVEMTRLPPFIFQFF